MTQSDDFIEEVDPQETLLKGVTSPLAAPDQSPDESCSQVWFVNFGKKIFFSPHGCLMGTSRNAKWVPRAL